MPALVTAEANRLLDASLGTTTYTAPTGAMKLALVTANGSGTSAGTEVAGGSYARQTIAFSAASSGSAANSSLITFTAMPACTVVGLEIYDSNGTPRRAWYGALSANKVLGSGDSISFAISSISIALS